MRIIPLVASQVNLPGFCEIIGSVPMGLECKTDHGRMLEILKRLGHKQVNFQLIIGVEAKGIFEDLRNLELFRIQNLKDDWHVVEGNFSAWRCCCQNETAHKKSTLREFFCQVYMALEMLFPELVMDLIRVPDQSGPLFSLNKRF